MTDGQAIRLRGETTIGPTRYVRYEAATPYEATGFEVQIRYGKATPAYLRQAARELCAALAEIAAELDATKGQAYGD
jgi:hypothetical protein